MARSNTQFLTCSFQLRQPSAWKQRALDYAFEEYTRSAATLLDIAQGKLEVIEEDGRVIRKDKKAGTDVVTDKFDAKSVGRVMPTSGQCPDFDLSGSMREAVVSDINAATASYMELMKIDDNTGFPTAFRHVEDERDAALESMRYEDSIQIGNMTWHQWERQVIELESDRRAALMRRPKSTVRPMTITRNRDFELLMDSNMSRFFVLLPILPNNHELIESAVVGDGTLICVRNGEPFKKKTKQSLLIPIEIGERNDQWHWQFTHFILPTLDGEASIKSAKLIKQADGRYKINVSFAFECQPEYKPETYLGIDRGVIFTMAYGIVSVEDGSIVEKDFFDDGLRSLQIDAGGRIKKRQQEAKRVTLKDYKRRAQEEILHRLVNKIIDIAIEHKSSIVLEDLNVKVAGSFVRSSWAKLEKIIRYKAKLDGVPVYGNIFAAKTSQICIHCGEDVIEHKRDGSPVVCGTCDRAEHADAAAGINIARRPMYRKKEWQKKGGYRGFYKSFKV